MGRSFFARINSRILCGTLLVCGAALLGFGIQAQAQDPECPPPRLGTTLLEKPPRPAKGPGSIGEFVEHLSLNDAAFEVVVGQGRILTTKVDLAVPGKAPSLVAVGDPTVVDFIVINNRQIRIVGQRIGITDLSITTPNNQTYNFELRVVADFAPLYAQLAKSFPDASVTLSQFRDHVAVEGQARDSAQVARIMETVKAYVFSVHTAQLGKKSSQSPPPQKAGQPAPPKDDGKGKNGEDEEPTPAAPEAKGGGTSQSTILQPRIINLLRVPGPRQVMLKVRIAELNRTAMRQIGTDMLFSGSSAIVGTRIGGGSGNTGASGVSKLLSGTASIASGSGTTLFGIFEDADFAIFFNVLRQNSILKILAEPNLVALHGHEASFLAGGEFPVPVPQTAGGGTSPTVTIQFKEFGVRLAFLPHILDGDMIRLKVEPEVSSIDFSIGTTLVPGGDPVPGLNTRNAKTTVEIKEGQTLAIAGLLQLTLDGTTNRIPGLGDLPVLGPFFSNTTGTRIEKELIVLVTPYLVEPMRHDQVPPTPGDEVNEPNDLELYLGNRIESRTGRDFRSTVNYDSQWPILRCLLRLENQNVRGPHGYCD